MAFVRTETWVVVPPIPSRGAHFAWPAALAPFFSSAAQRRAWRIASTFASLAVHCLLIWFFMTRLVAGTSEGQGSGSGDAIKLFDLSRSSQAEPDAAAAPASETLSLPTPQTAASSVDLTIPTLAPLAEWRVSRIAVPRPVVPWGPSSPSAPANSAAQGASGLGQTAGLGRGGGGYDPYAGAAPMRREEANAGLASSAPGIGTRLLGFLGLAKSIELDRIAFEAIRSSAERTMPRVNGYVLFIVRVSPTGMVLDAGVKDTDLSRPVLVRIRSLIVGRRLFTQSGPITDAQERELPVIRLG